jgi:circadian clock protein KaiC
MVMNQHGLPGTTRQTPSDVSYIADSVLLFHTFEFAGALHRAISVYKRREGPHEGTLRELRFGTEGVTVGEPLKDFHGIFTGSPTYRGERLPFAEGEEE